jgi:HAD superfamily phosphatase (TIGR01668 family)
MKLFRPKLHIRSVLEINRSFLSVNHVKGIILDLDNTLSTHGSPYAEEGIEAWLGEMGRLGIRLVLLSNNKKSRVEPFAVKHNLNFISFACKPLVFGVKRAMQILNLPKEEVIMVGDQIFTDVIGGNLFGLTTVLVEPFQDENYILFKLKRFAEKVVFGREELPHETNVSEND